MQRVDGGFVYSATDLNNFVECRRLTELEALVAFKVLPRPDGDDEQAELIREKGQAHEDRYRERLQQEYPDDVVCFGRAEPGAEAYREAERQTLEAMRRGAKIIYQATFFDGQFLGHADFLQRVETPSDLGNWSYEAIDTKLALSTKPYFIVQLCNYSEHLMRLQGRMPDRGYIVLGNGEKQGFRLHDYTAYYRHLKSRFLAFVSDPALAAEAAARVYPMKCNHCMVCPWNETCTDQRVSDDHLSLVAWMRRDQVSKLEDAGITTVAALAQADPNVSPKSMNSGTFAKLCKQARLQVRSRETAEPVYELLPHDPRTGFGLLPEAAPGDAYFDMEGDPLYEPGRGLEYLFGCWLPDDEATFTTFWGLDRAAEKQAFEQFVDFIVERRRRYPAMHVYHYANYEKAALRRLSQEHSTRGDEVDALLRGEVLVDLYAVVRQSLMIGEDSYSIKRLERFYGLQRSTEVKKGDQSIVMFENWRVHRDANILRDIEDYNKDDCESTYLLHRWLLARREEAIATLGVSFPFRPVKSPRDRCHAEFFEGCAKCKRRAAAEREQARTTDLERTLLQGIAQPQSDEEYYRLSDDWRTRYLMGHLLSYHRREEAPVWWAYFDRCENIDTLQDQDSEAIGGLEYCSDAAPYKLKPADRNLVHTYRFPEQRHKLDRGYVHDPRLQDSAGEIIEIDEEQNILRLKRSGSADDAKAVDALIPRGPINTDLQRSALTRIAQAYQAGTLQTQHPATFDLLSSRDPRVVGHSVLQPEEVSAQSVSAVVQALDNSYLFIQGPPGSGKSTTGSQVICDLLRAGKRVGVLSTGHKAIHHLLHKVEDCMAERGGTFRGLYKHSNTNAGSAFQSRLEQPFIESIDDAEAFDSGDYDLAGGTAWLFAREELAGTFDYLFIDEAGQVSLADAIAVSACAKNVVLLGDPSQLAQVSLGTHSSHADDSILQHLLAQATTVPPHRGIFLDISYRMHPDICSFISTAMYDGRLHPGAKTHLHRVTSTGLSGSGLRYLPIEHFGNGPRSVEEADRIVREIVSLLDGTVVDDDGKERPLRQSDIIVVAPYNAQRKLITSKLKSAGIDVAVGTVDKFQGQEAAVVFYSMATSSGDDIPRDIEFLFEPNRFNVAISRARAMSVLVCSPKLLDLSCRSADQMALLNVVCAYVEHARGAIAV